MTKKFFTPSERYAAPEMKVVELNLNSSVLTGSVNAFTIDDYEDDVDAPIIFG